MRIVSSRPLRDFWSRPGCEDAEEPLLTVIRLARANEWSKFADVRNTFASADVVGDRIVLNVRGNRYRLVLAMDYPRGIAYVKFVGTHAEYDKIDVATVELP